MSAFDCALVGFGPVSIELGWFIAINWRYLGVRKEHLLSEYYRMLTALRPEINDQMTFAALYRDAIVWGALRQLWARAIEFSRKHQVLMSSGLGGCKS